MEDGLRDGQFKFNLLMQDEERRKKFNLIKRFANAFDQIEQGVLDAANNIDNRRQERLARRSNRRNQRAIRRSERRSKRTNKRQ